MLLVVRPRSEETAGLAAVVRKLVSSKIDAEVASLQTTEEFLREVARPYSFRALFVGAPSILASCLTIIGICASLAQRIVERRKDLGLRIALGANRKSIVSMLVSRT